MIDKAFGVLADTIERILALAFVFAVCLNFTNVVGRYGFGSSILWGDEVQIYIMVWMAFLGAVVAAWRGLHLRMDMLVKMFPRRIRAAVVAAEFLVLIAVVGLMFAQSSLYVWRMLSLGQKSDVAGVPMWIPHSALALGFGLIVLIGLWRAFRFVSGGFDPALAEVEQQEEPS
jgi:TRAP-type C4-dicarboxylate transport system permease small subunit